jgi:hypothetical protein
MKNGCSFHNLYVFTGGKSYLHPFTGVVHANFFWVYTVYYEF